MPQTELRYSSDLALDGAEILTRIEEIILQHDGGAGASKGRAYPAAAFTHTHLMATVSLLPKPHRDDAFVDALKNDVFAYLAELLPRPCWLSVDVNFSGNGYQTEFLE
ncbi:hypothetical protein E4Z66_02875 [Aliishimia ponticola]|uniref:5-carboxymethyl-2-hydroxymuconate isomerase n=1 Tax=Aliishimia ponticola TaxID=2499833 RepID=A0A4S4NJS6_9RHOB|nr:hypothetical protein [Aliishimia ponticola]THH38528.1 hypothetical protein E4Z66_02875 [Aliishimia ponticola]